MKHLWLLPLIVAAATGPARAQTPKALSPPKTAAATQDSKVHTYVEKMPQPPGGGSNAAVVTLIQRRIHLPAFNVDSIEGSRVVVGFTITAVGAVRDVRIRKGIDHRIDSAVVRAVRALPRFTPGCRQGRPVSVQYTIPITFCWQ